MNYKILLVGRAPDVINGFFENLGNQFELFASSPNFANLSNAIKYFPPDAVIYCMDNEMPEYIHAVASFMKHKSMSSIPLIILGRQSDCDLYHVLTHSAAELLLSREETFDIIANQIASFLSRESRQPDKPQWSDALMLTDNSKDDGRKRILVVDDSPIMLKTIANSLHNDYNVATAISGRIALRYLQNKSVDLILLDYEMPDENGAEVMERLRNNPATASIPIIFLTGVQDTQKVQSVLAMKPDGYILKPVETVSLMRKIRSILH